MKTCRKGLHQYDATRHQCPECVKARMKAWYAAWYANPANHERKKAANTAWSAAWRANPHNRERERVRHLHRAYGITPDGLKVLLEQQGHTCPVCLGHVTEMDDVDHDHATGKVRSVLHRQCNLGLGSMNDDPARLRRGADYIERNR